jgi:hypothetical protein
MVNQDVPDAIEVSTEAFRLIELLSESLVRLSAMKHIGELVGEAPHFKVFKGTKSKDDDNDQYTMATIETYVMEFRGKGLKPEAFAPFMFDLTQMNFEAKVDPLRLFAYIRLVLEGFNENIYD